jgi:hypothetical protein
MDERRPQMQRSHRNAFILTLTCLIRCMDESQMTCLFSAVGWTRFSTLEESLAVFPANPRCATSAPFIFLLRCHLLYASGLSPTSWATSLPMAQQPWDLHSSSFQLLIEGALWPGREGEGSEDSWIKLVTHHFHILCFSYANSCY